MNESDGSFKDPEIARAASEFNAETPVANSAEVIEQTSDNSSKPIAEGKESSVDLAVERSKIETTRERYSAEVESLLNENNKLNHGVSLIINLLSASDQRDSGGNVPRFQGFANHNVVRIGELSQKSNDLWNLGQATFDIPSETPEYVADQEKIKNELKVGYEELFRQIETVREEQMDIIAQMGVALRDLDTSEKKKWYNYWRRYGRGTVENS
jgi:hypothetical protein